MVCFFFCRVYLLFVNVNVYRLSFLIRPDTYLGQIGIFIGVGTGGGGAAGARPPPPQ